MYIYIYILHPGYEILFNTRVSQRTNGRNPGTTLRSFLEPQSDPVFYPIFSHLRLFFMSRARSRTFTGISATTTRAQTRRLRGSQIPPSLPARLLRGRGLVCADFHRYCRRWSAAQRRGCFEVDTAGEGSSNTAALHRQSPSLSASCGMSSLMKSSNAILCPR
jgi:hypothetical protein